MSSLADRKQTGLIFNIQKYSVHDGPGIRTLVFFKGCPLRCEWCSNPESQSFEPQIAYNENKCLTFAKCMRCAEVCTAGALSIREDDKIRIDYGVCCGGCQDCAAQCPSGALQVFGEKQSVDDVLKVVEQDAIFYARSGGGMTVSGGEPLAQPAFLHALLREARRRRIKTAIETSGYAPYEALSEACKSLNSVMYDIKHMDPEMHKKHTGVSNERILENFDKMCAEFPDLPILARTPVVPGFNDNEEAIRAIAEFVKGRPNVKYEMLPYHRLGTQKYQQIGKVNPMGDVTLSDETFSALRGVAAAILGE